MAKQTIHYLKQAVYEVREVLHHSPVKLLFFNMCRKPRRLNYHLP